MILTDAQINQYEYENRTSGLDKQSAETLIWRYRELLSQNEEMQKTLEWYEKNGGWLIDNGEHARLTLQKMKEE